MIQVGRMFGQSLALSGLSLGDLASDNSSKQSTATTNAQVSLQGTDNIGVSSNTIGAGGSLVIDGGSKLAAEVVSASEIAVTQAYAALEASQTRALATVDAAVHAASETALKATPTPATDLAGQQSTDAKNMLLLGGFGLAALFLFTTKRT